MIQAASSKNLSSASKPTRAKDVQDATKDILGRLKRSLEPPGNATKLVKQESTQKRLKRTVQAQCSTPKFAKQDGEALAIRRYEDLQNSLQQVFWECNEVWRSSTSYKKTGPRKSWRAAMGHLQILLTATLSETLISKETRKRHAGLHNLRVKNLGNAAALLWRKIQRQKRPSVFQNHMTYLQEVMQATSEQVCWKTILDELLTNETLTDCARREQSTYLTTRIHDTNIKIQTAIERAQSNAVLQNQHRSNSHGN